MAEYVLECLFFQIFSTMSCEIQRSHSFDLKPMEPPRQNAIPVKSESNPE